jgi:hypothetical protein
MSRSTAVLVTVVACLGLVMPAAAFAQAPKEAEIKSEVPALTAMHDIIYPMWHEAWPAKDHAALAALLPKIEGHMAAISKATLPGILREKAAAWDAGVVELKKSVAAYKAAVDTKDNDALLKAAEVLHMKYEALGKVVRPSLKEMADFHTSLYTLYHYQLNPFNKVAAADTIKALKAKMDTLNKTVLPDQFKAKAEAFTAQRTRLSKAVDAVVAATGDADQSRVTTAIELMHAEYEKLERVF